MSGIRVAITGMGVVTAVSGSVPEFAEALRTGCSGVRLVENRPVRVGAFLKDPKWELAFERHSCRWEAAFKRAKKVLRGSPLATRVGVMVALEALAASGPPADPQETAVVVGGNNIHQQFMQEHYRHFLEKPEYVNPRYAFSFLDSHMAGALSEVFGFGGPGFSTGATSASGNAALFHGWNLLQSSQAMSCLCVGALADFGALEFRALFNLGALSPTCFEEAAFSGYRPFDKTRDGIFFGQASAAVVLEPLREAVDRGAAVLGEISGVSLTMHRHHATEPDAAGEARAMRKALEIAGISASAVQYVNAHGTGSPAGDDAECAAIRDVFAGMPEPAVNSTKSITGHTIFAAGLVEAVATVLQMNHGFLHPNPALETPVDSTIRFAGRQAEPAQIDCALSNSFSFGGINSSVVLRKYQE